MDSPVSVRLVKDPSELHNVLLQRVDHACKRSIVYRGQEKNGQERMCAIKTCLKRQLIKEKKVEYAKREKEALIRVSCKEGHPLIVRLYETMQDEEHLYFILSYAENGDLLHHMWEQKDSKFSLEHTVFYTAEVLSAIQHIHSLSIIHRDLKPENVLLRSTGHIMLSDFGSCKIISEEQEKKDEERSREVREDGEGNTLRRRCSFVGTAQYVSPEILKGEKISRAVDYWGLGVLVFQLITGKHAFDDEAEYLIFRRIQKRLFSFPSQMDETTKNLIDSLIVIDPSKRLGCSEDGVERIRQHPFFLPYSIPWNDITSFKLPNS